MKRKISNSKFKKNKFEKKEERESNIDKNAKKKTNTEKGSMKSKNRTNLDMTTDENKIRAETCKKGDRNNCNATVNAVKDKKSIEKTNVGQKNLQNDKKQSKKNITVSNDMKGEVEIKKNVKPGHTRTTSKDCNIATKAKLKTKGIGSLEDPKENIKVINKRENRAKNKKKLQRKVLSNKSIKMLPVDQMKAKTQESKKPSAYRIAQNEKNDNKTSKLEGRNKEKSSVASHSKTNSVSTGMINPRKNKYSATERELLTSGTKKDKIDVLTLIIEKNPDNCFEELSQLLEMAQNERNDTVYYILKNITDLLCSKLVFTSDFIKLKRKFVSTLEYYMKNQFIKNKLIILVYTLLSKNILFIDLIYIFINKLGDKKETSTLIVNHIEKLYMLDISRDVIKFGLEELYQRDIKARKKILETMNKIAKHDDDPGKMNLLFYQTLKNKEYTDKTKFEKTLENILLTFLKDITAIDKDNFDETLLFQDYKLPSLNYTILLFLYKSKSKGFYSALLNCVRKDKMVGYKNMSDYLNLLHEYLITEKDEIRKYNLIESMFSAAIFYDDKYIISLLLIFSQITSETGCFDTLHVIAIYLRHTNSIISLLAQQLIDKKAISLFNPFDSEELERISVLASATVS